MSKSKWSDWIDFNHKSFSKIPELPGVFMMHASMKILFIGGSENMKKTITDTALQECISKSTRFRFRKEENYEKIRIEVINDFKKRHEGNLPDCMK